jgi:hypothetical protein
VRREIHYNPLPYTKLSYYHFKQADIMWEGGKKAEPAVQPEIEPATEIDQAVKKRVGYWKGKSIPPEVRAKISAVQKGRKMSDETRRKMSEAKKGDKCYMYGKTHSPEMKRKFSEGAKKMWQERKKKDAAK